MAMKVQQIEVNFRKLGKDGWKEVLPETEDFPDALDKFLDGVIDKYGAELSGSYAISIKINKGYGKNPETGGTIKLTWKNRLSRIYELLHTALEWK